jgi:hypothetical protein
MHDRFRAGTFLVRASLPVGIYAAWPGVGLCWDGLASLRYGPEHVARGAGSAEGEHAGVLLHKERGALVLV